MKRILLSVIVLVTGLAQANAQIQREFLGCSLGASPQEVFQEISDKGYNIENTDDGFSAQSMENNPIVFRGCEWEYVFFSFYEDKLYSVSFVLSTDKSPVKTVIDGHNSLMTQFEEEYSQYKDENSDGKISIWNDGNTAIICKYFYFDDNANEVDYTTDKASMGAMFFDYKVSIRIVSEESEE